MPVPRPLVFFQARGRAVEDASAVLVVLKLIKARAGRRQKNGVARPRESCATSTARAHGPGALHGNDAGKVRFNLLRRAAISSAIRAWRAVPGRSVLKSLPCLCRPESPARSREMRPAP